MARSTVRLQLLLMGPPRVELSEDSIKLETRKATALLAYLSMCPRGTRRESLAALFWPEYDQANAFNNLRRTLASLNKSLDGEWLEADRETISLRGGPELYQDVSSFDECLARCRAHCGQNKAPCGGCIRALEGLAFAYRGDFLDGLNLPDCPAFDDWQRTQRERLRAEFAWVLERLAQAHGGSRQWDRAISHARRWVSLDPLHEPAQRTLIELLARAGQKSAAIKRYEQFAKLLDDELGARPEKSTVDLYNAALEGTLSPQSTQRLTSAPAEVGRPAWEPFLQTKLFIPPVRADTVMRRRLAAIIDRGMQRPFTLVSAPAGFGKTTLLSSWAARTKLCVAWVSLDAEDNDPRRLARAVILALRSVRPELGETPLEMSATPPFAPLAAMLTDVLNEMTGDTNHVALVLDDYHVLREPSAHDVVSFLLEHLPPSLHLAVLTRSDPPLPVARFRVRGQLTELRAEDLRFSTKEAEEFLNGIRGLNISGQHVAILEARTEGWIAGLHMAALSLQGRQDIAGFIEGFSGSHRFVMDYLTDEVLGKQPDDIQDFLARTSILDRFCAALCDVVAETPGRSSSILHGLEKANLFLVPLDDTRTWFRYHHLFADLLRARLSEAHASQVPVLHIRASEWFESNGFLEDAFAHAHAAGDHGRMIRLIEQSSASMIREARLATLADWIALLPQALLADKPLLSVLHAWGHVSKGQMQKAEPLLAEAETHIARDDGGREIQELHATIAALRSQIAETAGDMSATIALARFALEKLAQESLVARVSTTYVLGRAFFTTCAFDHARPLLEQLVRDVQGSQTFHLYCPCTGLLAAMLRIEGKLREADHTYREVMRVMHERGVERFFVGGNTFLGLAANFRERNELAEAERLADQGILCNRRWGNLNAIATGLSTRARILVAQGRTESAAELLREEQELVHGFDPYPDVRSNMTSALVELHLVTGRPDQALMVAERDKLPATDSRILWREQDEIALGRALIANGRAQESIALLGPLANHAEAAGRFGRLLEILVLPAVALHTCGKAAAAAALRRSLRLAAPEGFVRVFLDEGKPMRELLSGMKPPARKDLAAYAQRLIAAFAGG